MKSFFNVIEAIICITANILGVSDHITKILGWLSLPVEYDKPIKIVLLIIGIFLIIHILYKFFLTKDSLAKKIYNSSFSRHIHHRFCNKKKQNLLNLQSDMYHILNKINEIKQIITQIEKKDRLLIFESFFDDMMKSISSSFDQIFHISISINIFFQKEEKGNMVLYKWKTLHAQEIVSSNQDKDYIIHSCSKRKRLQDFALNAKNYFNQHDDEGYMKNSIYDYILTTHNNHWISNNVNDDINKGELFISKDDDEDKYNYNSLAVFAIAKSISQKRIETIGLLTFESPDINAFTKEESHIIMKHFAQIIYEAVTEIQK